MSQSRWESQNCSTPAYFQWNKSHVKKPCRLQPKEVCEKETDLWDRARGREAGTTWCVGEALVERAELLEVGRSCGAAECCCEKAHAETWSCAWCKAILGLNPSQEPTGVAITSLFTFSSICSSVTELQGNVSPREREFGTSSWCSVSCTRPSGTR